MFRGHSIALCLTSWPPTPTGHPPVPVAPQSHFTDDEMEAQKTSMIGPQSLNNRVPSRCRQMLTLLGGNLSTALGEQGNNGNPYSDHGEGNTSTGGVTWCDMVIPIPIVKTASSGTTLLPMTAQWWMEQLSLGVCRVLWKCSH